MGNRNRRRRSHSACSLRRPSGAVAKQCQLCLCCAQKVALGPSNEAHALPWFGLDHGWVEQIHEPAWRGLRRQGPPGAVGRPAIPLHGDDAGRQYRDAVAFGVRRC